MRNLVLLSILAIAGCSRGMSYDQQDATRANAINALNEAQSAKAEAEQARMQVEELAAKVDRMCGQAPQLCY